MLGRSLFSLGEYEPAVGALKKALEFDGSNTGTHYFLGWAYAKMAEVVKDRGKQIHYKSLAQEQCNAINEDAPEQARMLQAHIDIF